MAALSVVVVEAAQRRSNATRGDVESLRLEAARAAGEAFLAVQMDGELLRKLEDVSLTLDMLWERYRLGQASLVDVLTVQGDWQDAELARCRERFAYGAARIALALLTGDNLGGLSIGGRP